MMLKLLPLPLYVAFTFTFLLLCFNHRRRNPKSPNRALATSLVTIDRHND
jgi:hypothetical protein